MASLFRNVSRSFTVDVPAGKVVRVDTDLYGDTARLLVAGIARMSSPWEIINDCLKFVVAPHSAMVDVQNMDTANRVGRFSIEVATRSIEDPWLGCNWIHPSLRAAAERDTLGAAQKDRATRIWLRAHVRDLADGRPLPEQIELAAIGAWSANDYTLAIDIVGDALGYSVDRRARLHTAKIGTWARR